MSRDAYMDIGGRATQDAKAEDTTAGMQEVATVLSEAGRLPGRRW